MPWVSRYELDTLRREARLQRSHVREEYRARQRSIGVFDALLQENARMRREVRWLRHELRCLTKKPRPASQS